MRMNAVIGHRGAAKIAPENTLAGIQAAYDCGLSWVEMDVVLLGDGALVMHHDRTLNRCTDGNGELLSLTLKDVKYVEAGVKFGDQFSGEPVPTFQETLDFLEHLDMSLNLEIKMHKHTPEELTLPVLEVLKHHPLVKKGKVLISCFDHDVLALCHANQPHIPLGHLFEGLPHNWLTLARAVNAVTIHVNQKRLSRSQATDVVQAGYELYCYTVNNAQRAMELMSWGVVGVFTDDPDEIKKIVP